MLGRCLLARGAYAEAEASLREGYEGMRRAKVPAAARPRLAEAAAALAELYTAWGKPAEAARWRAERAKYGREVAPPPRPAM